MKQSSSAVLSNEDICLSEIRDSSQKYSFGAIRGVTSAAVVFAMVESEETLEHAPRIASNIVIDQCLNSDNEVTFESAQSALQIADRVLKDVANLDKEPLDCSCRILVICFGQGNSSFFQTGFSKLMSGKSQKGQLSEIEKIFNLSEQQTGSLESFFSKATLTEMDNCIGGKHEPDIISGQHSIEFRDGSSVVAFTDFGEKVSYDLSGLAAEGYSPSETAVFRSRKVSPDLLIANLLYGPWRFERTDEFSENQKRYTLTSIVESCRALDDNPQYEDLGDFEYTFQTEDTNNIHTSSELASVSKLAIAPVVSWLLCLSVLALLSVLAFPSSL